MCAWSATWDRLPVFRNDVGPLCRFRDISSVLLIIFCVVVVYRPPLLRPKKKRANKDTGYT